MSVGGALGGLLTTLVAPLVFVGITEYPVGIVAALLLRPGVRWASAASLRGELTTPAVVLAVMLAMAAVAHLLGAQVRSFLWLALIFAPALLISMLVWHRRVPFGLSVGAIVLVSTWFGSSGGEELYAERNFFGQIRVVLDDGGAYRVLVHGNTMHGMQPTDPTREFELVSYYHEKSGIAGVFSAVGPRLAASPVAVVGLGAGSLALYAQPNQHWTYYELNPSVIRVARDPRLFTMLSHAGESVDVVPGDARLSLARAPDAHYGVIVLDAFSSDAIPVHLMTREAVELYFKKLAPGGVVVFHVSNRYLRLVPVLGSIAHDRGYHALSHSVSRMTESEMARGRTGGTWVAMARHAEDLASLTADATWTSVSPGPDSTRWTDDYSNLVAVLALPWSQPH
jgi:spermidine synthase